MPAKPVPLFLNPVAGRGRAGRTAAAISSLLANHGAETTLIESTCTGDLERRVFEYASNEKGPIIVAGGDGSVHEAANGILSAGHHTPLGLVPIGTGNDFAKACGISLEWETAASLLAGRIADCVPGRLIDVGRMNGRFFANGAGIGFDAKINRIARKYRWRIGDLVYLVAVLEGLWDGVITPAVVMRHDGEEYRGRITLASISNGAWAGGMFYIAPMAENDDGHLDLVAVAPVSRCQVLALLPKLIKGTHIDEAGISCRRIESFELVAEAPLPSHLDGEDQPLQKEFCIEVLPGALSLI